MRERETGIVIAFLKAAIEQKPFQIEKQEIEWEIVEKILKFHRVINMAYYGYLQLENKECVPKQFVENMKKVNEKLTAKEACQHFGLEEIREKFEQERIAFLPLKGCILKYYYPAPQMRYMGDLDILYKEEQKDVLHQCLGELGYQFLSSDEVHDAYGKKPFLHIEMHCKLFGKQEKQKKYFEHIWEYVHLADGKQFEYEMTQEDYYLFLLAHMEKHFLQGGTGLRSLTDFHVFHQKKGNELNRQIVKMRLEEMELDRFEAFLFELDACVFGESEWSDVELMQTFDYMLLSGIYGVRSSWDANRVLKKKGADKTPVLGKIQCMIQTLFPSPRVLQSRYPWLKGRGYLIGLAWIIRMMRCLFLEREESMDVLMRANVDDTKLDEMQQIHKRAGLKG